MAESDQLSVLWDYAKVVLKEAYLHRVKVASGFALVSISVLVTGYFYPKSYSTSMTLFADKSNIIGSLLRGQAASTRITDHSRVVRETIFSPRLLKMVVEQSGDFTGKESAEVMERRMNKIRSNIVVKSLGASYIKVEYSAPTPSLTYNTINSIVDMFIQDSSDSQKTESRSAFEFIDNQVNTYRGQLQSAEERLKNFKSSSEDGNEQGVERRIAQLRANVENMDLDIEDIRTRISSLQVELKKEGQYVNKRYKTDIHREGMHRARQQMDVLLLNYTEDHPDVVTLRYQIEDLAKQIRDAEAGNTEIESTSSESQFNPLYDDLRAQISDAKVQLKSKFKRRGSTVKLMEEERARLQRVAADQAQLSELTRDYNVTKKIYEDMLDRKEKARLSMTLDIQGKGINFKIQEPATYPLTPKGLRFLYFLFAGPILGFIIPVGIVLAYVIVDPRIRFARDVQSEIDFPVLGIIPHVNTPIGTRIFGRDVMAIGVIMLLVVGIYGTAVAIKLSGAT